MYIIHFNWYNTKTSVINVITIFSKLQFQVQGTIWRPLYFGSTNPEDNIFFNGEFRFSLTTLALTTAFSGVLYVLFALFVYKGPRTVSYLICPNCESLWLHVE